MTTSQVTECIGERGQEYSPLYNESHTLIYRAAIAIDKRGEAIDLLSLANQLRLDGSLDAAGGTPYLVELTSKVVTTANVEAHARIVLEKFISREMIRTCEEIKLRAFLQEDDTFELLDQAEGSLFKLSETRHRKSFQ